MLRLAFIFILVALAGPVRAATPLVDVDWLKDRIGQSDVIVLDVRSKLAGVDRKDYEKAHIPGALYSAYPGIWRTDRDGVTGVVPSVEKLEASLSELGVSEDKTVVIVPAGTTSLDFGAAARIYWTFKYLGHDKVSILDGGHAAWAAAGGALESGWVVPEGDLFEARLQEELNISTAEVANLSAADTVLLDARPVPQFRGKEKHPAAARFGRLPGAQNLVHDDFFDAARGRLKEPSALRAAVPADFNASTPIVSYCNTGHWAATNWFVLHEVLGYEKTRLYDESMVGWSLDGSRPMASERNRLDDLKDWLKGLTG